MGIAKHTRRIGANRPTILETGEFKQPDDISKHQRKFTSQAFASRLHF